MITSKLSSDILEEQFGSTTIKILHQDDEMRIIQTTASNSGKVLELSLVRFLSEGIAAFPEVHRAILAGQSMGKAFRAADIAFQRETAFACRHAVPAALQERFGSKKPATVAAVRILVGSDRMPYATITETYTPYATWPHLFSQVTAQAKADLATLANTLPQ